VKNQKSPDERDRLISQALVKLFELQMHSGATPVELARLAHRCVSTACDKVGLSPSENKSLDAQDYGTVLKTWHRDAKFLSREGYPRGLSINGRFGLRSLIEQYYPKDQFSTVLKSLSESGLIVKGSGGKWHPTERCAVFPNLNSELLAHLSEGISGLIDTVTKNVTKRSRDDALFERSAKVRFLPASKANEFRRFVRRQGEAFLGAVDDWLESRADRSTKTRHRYTAGAFAFAFINEQEERSRKVRSRGRRARTG
jgi:Family of unknown function (DUF6502)